MNYIYNPIECLWVRFKINPDRLVQTIDFRYREDRLDVYKNLEHYISTYVTNTKYPLEERLLVKTSPNFREAKQVAIDTSSSGLPELVWDGVEAYPITGKYVRGQWQAVTYARKGATAADIAKALQGFDVLAIHNDTNVIDIYTQHPGYVIGNRGAWVKRIAKLGYRLNIGEVSKEEQMTDLSFLERRNLYGLLNIKSDCPIPTRAFPALEKFLKQNH